MSLEGSHKDRPAIVINCPKADIWACENVQKSAGWKIIIMRQNSGNYTNML
jgi:hypothetical protein